MKPLLIISILLISNISFAKGKPGLWQTSYEMEFDGKKIDPVAQMRQMLAAMPEAQKKQMLEMYAKDNPELKKMLSNKPMQTCVTKEMINNNDFMKDPTGSCKFKTLKSTGKIIDSEFSCKDGNKGQMKWVFSNDENYIGTIKSSQNGKKFLMRIMGKFIKSKC